MNVLFLPMRLQPRVVNCRKRNFWNFGVINGPFREAAVAALTFNEFLLCTKAISYTLSHVILTEFLLSGYYFPLRT